VQNTKTYQCVTWSQKKSTARTHIRFTLRFLRCSSWAAFPALEGRSLEFENKLGEAVDNAFRQFSARTVSLTPNEMRLL
jgi:hypothetical protein